MDTTSAAEPTDIRLEASRTMAWLRLGFGWVAAQSFLTLMPIAPDWGDWGLALAGGFFAAVGVSGALRLGGTLSLALEARALSLGPTAIPWAEVERWRLTTSSPRRLEVALSPEAARRLPLKTRAALLSPKPRTLVYRAGDLQATLTEAAAALRQAAPDKEGPP